MNKIFSLFTSIAVVLTLVFVTRYNVLASPVTYYVSTTGSDVNPGTLDAPFQTIDKAISVSQAGNYIYVRGGTYSAFTVTKSGTVASPITISGYLNEKPIIYGGTGIRLAYVSYIVIRGFQVTNASGNGITRLGGILITGGGNNIIEYCHVHDNYADSLDGIKIEGSSGNHINHNLVHDNGGVGIRVIGYFPSLPSQNNEIGWNTVYNHTAAGSNADGIGLINNVSNTHIHDNVVYGNADDGIDTWNTSNNLIVGNVSYGQLGPGDGNGFKLGGATTGGNNIIKQNIAYNNKLNGFDSNGSGGNKYYNNVAYNNTNFGFEDGWKNSLCTPSVCQTTYINNIGYNNIRGNFSASIYTAVSHNNLWYSDPGFANVYYGYTLYQTLPEFYSASGNHLDNPSAAGISSLSSAPQFFNAQAAIFTLLPSSPAIDKGDITNPGGVSAINVVDIGAFEYSENNLAPTVNFRRSFPLDGALLTEGISSLKVAFNKEVLHNGKANAANNLSNYLLAEAGANGIFDTLSCKDGVKTDDIPIKINLINYDAASLTTSLAVNNAIPLPNGNYKLWVCGTTSVTDLDGLKLNYGLFDSTLAFRIDNATDNSAGKSKAKEKKLPATGFAQQVTFLTEQPAAQGYNTYNDLALEIPVLKVNTSIVGVPETTDGWDVTWLGTQAGWLNGTAFPTWSGNSVLVGHVWAADNRPGIFINLKQLEYGDQIKIHAWSQVYIYEVRENYVVSPTSINIALKHEDAAWLTLITCEDFNSFSAQYDSRRLIRAVFISVTVEN